MFASVSALARGPAMNRAGSPGTTRDRKSVMKVTPHRTKTMSTIRRASHRIRRSRRAEAGRPLQELPRPVAGSAAIERVEVPGEDVQRVGDLPLDVDPVVGRVDGLADRDDRRIDVLAHDP